MNTARQCYMRYKIDYNNIRHNNIHTGGTKELTKNNTTIDAIKDILNQVVGDDRLVRSIRNDFSWYIKSIALKLDKNKCMSVNVHSSDVIEAAKESARRNGVVDVKIGGDVPPVSLANEYIDIVCANFEAVNDSDIALLNRELSKVNDVIEKQRNIENDIRTRCNFERFDNKVRVGFGLNLLIYCDELTVEEINELISVFGHNNFPLGDDPYGGINGIILLNVKHRSLLFNKYTRRVCDLMPEMGYGIPINSNSEKFARKFKDPSGPASRGARLAVFIKVENENDELYVLVCQHKTRGTLFPGGGADVDEDLHNTARRETTEETGFVVDPSIELHLVNALAFPYHLGIDENTFERCGLNILYACEMRVKSLPENLVPTEKEDDIVGSRFVKCSELLSSTTVDVLPSPNKPSSVGGIFKESLQRARDLLASGQ